MWVFAKNYGGIMFNVPKGKKIKKKKYIYAKVHKFWTKIGYLEKNL